MNIELLSEKESDDERTMAVIQMYKRPAPGYGHFMDFFKPPNLDFNVGDAHRPECMHCLLFRQTWVRPFEA